MTGPFARRSASLTALEVALLSPLPHEFAFTSLNPVEILREFVGERVRERGRGSQKSATSKLAAQGEMGWVACAKRSPAP
jgi:hypothetical protein